MSNTEMQLPKEYLAFEKLTICSNVLINGKVPIRIKDHFPILVGKGDVPLIWLSATKAGKEWQMVVEKNQPLNKNFSVNFLDDKKSVFVTIGNIIIVQAKKISDGEAEISTLDLRPLGLDIRGDQSGFYIGTNSFVGNVFQNIIGMIDIA